MDMDKPPIPEAGEKCRSNTRSRDATLICLASSQNKLQQHLAILQRQLSSYEQLLSNEFDTLASQSMGLSDSFEDKPSLAVDNGMQEIPAVPSPAVAMENGMQKISAAGEQPRDESGTRRTESHTKVKRASKLQKIVSEAFVEEKERHEQFPLIRRVCRKMIKSRIFEPAVSIVIVVNAVLIGAETEMSIRAMQHEEYYARMEKVEWIFIALYTIESLIRCIALGRKLLKDRWFQFDLSILLFGYLGKVAFASAAMRNSELAVLTEQLFLVRIFRMLRLIRALRVLKLFRHMWLLVYGMLSSMETMMSTLGLLFLAIYVFACIGIDIITKDQILATHESTAAIVAYNFGNIWRTMLTLMQFVTMDSIASVYIPLIVLKPGLAIYFVIALLFISISLMNLVTASIVQVALDNAAKDKILQERELKARMKKVLPAVMEVFNKLDDDHSGFLSLEEMKHLSLDSLPTELTDKVPVLSMDEMFTILDIHGEGFLTKEEFVEGLLDLSLMEVQLPIVQILKLSRNTYTMLQACKEELSSVAQNARSPRKGTPIETEIRKRCLAEL
eukprot:TRINITY_DN33759_c0_g1_i1.p1 TRINITY_DN33759_c0_g1~~TRINITY_DN33759_c0_g1_i1.p1  ORF type:complete len:571 (-),score=96.62 TRINITY_DN33759_c0_g1_i1:21-1700(-)